MGDFVIIIIIIIISRCSVLVPSSDVARKPARLNDVLVLHFETNTNSANLRGSIRKSVYTTSVCAIEEVTPIAVASGVFVILADRTSWSFDIWTFLVPAENNEAKLHAS